MSRLLDFYRGDSTDIEGRTLEEIWSWSDDDLEEVHDYIQWLFPLPEPSQFNPDAPLLTRADIAIFNRDPILQKNLMISFERILSFLGLEWTAEGTVCESDKFTARVTDVWSMPNHNWLRISRILRSLTLMGLRSQANALYARLSDYHNTRKFQISAETFHYWTDALREDT